MKGKKTGGREKGTPNKRTKALIKVSDEAVAQGISPIELMLKNMRKADAMADAAEEAAIIFAKDALSKLDGDQLLNAMIAEAKKVTGLRTFAQECARDAAPYCHARYQSIAHTGADGTGPAVFEIRWKESGDE